MRPTLDSWTPPNQLCRERETSHFLGELMCCPRPFPLVSLSRSTRHLRLRAWRASTIRTPQVASESGAREPCETNARTLGSGEKCTSLYRRHLPMSLSLPGRRAALGSRPETAGYGRVLQACHLCCVLLTSGSNISLAPVLRQGLRSKASQHSQRCLFTVPACAAQAYHTIPSVDGI